MQKILKHADKCIKMTTYLFTLTRAPIIIYLLTTLINVRLLSNQRYAVAKPMGLMGQRKPSLISSRSEEFGKTCMILVGYILIARALSV